MVQREAELEGVRQELSQARSSVREMERQMKEVSRGSQREVGRLREDLSAAETANRKLARQLESDRIDREAFNHSKEELAKANERIAELIVSLDLQEQLSKQQPREKKP